MIFFGKRWGIHIDDYSHKILNDFKGDSKDPQ